MSMNGTSNDKKMQYFAAFNRSKANVNLDKYIVCGIDKFIKEKVMIFLEFSVFKDKMCEVLVVLLSKEFNSQQMRQINISLLDFNMKFLINEKLWSLIYLQNCFMHPYQSQNLHYTKGVKTQNMYNQYLHTTLNIFFFRIYQSFPRNQTYQQNRTISSDFNQDKNLQIKNELDDLLNNYISLWMNNLLIQLKL